MRLLVVLALALCAATGSARAYVDVTPTLARVTKDSQHIILVRVAAVDRPKQVIVYRKSADLKGRLPAEELRHQITDGFPPREPKRILDWAQPGQTAVCFFSGRICLVALGESWYECAALNGPWWTMTRERPELSLAYSGSADKLGEHVKAILAGRQTVITTVAHGANGRGAFFEVAMKASLRGRDCPLQRIRASLGMPDQVYLIGRDPRYFVGLGPAGIEDVPALIKAMSGADRPGRLEAANHLGLIGSAAKGAVPALAAALRDDDLLVRVRAAEALAKVDPGQSAALEALARGLRAGEAPVRRAAAEALAQIGPGAAQLVPALLPALADPQRDVRWAAAEALGEIGPAAQAAAAALTTLLKDAAMRCVAAEALGGIGANARSAVPALAEGLKNDDLRFRWAAARALALVGGDGAEAAVPALLEMMGREQRDYYNATLYLAALGPQAKAAIPTLTAKADELASMALWAIEPDKKFPWDLWYHADRDCDLWLFASYVRMMGPRGQSAAIALAGRCLAGRDADAPSWAYHLLREHRQPVLALLLDKLKGDDPAQRRRAARTLGRMGSSAQSAEAALSEAAKDPDPSVRSAAAQALKMIRPEI
jgi:HEAT repeat protein